MTANKKNSVLQVESSGSQLMSKRILVLGSSGHTKKVDSHEWISLPKNLNVADYDVVIMNILPFCSKDWFKKSGIKLDELPSARQFARLIYSEGSELIVIGFPYQFNFQDEGKDATWQIVNSAWWSPPVIPAFEFVSGTEIRHVSDEFSQYFQNVNEYYGYATNAWSLDRYRHTEYAQFVDPDANFSFPSLVALASTRFQQPVAFELIYTLCRIRSDYYDLSSLPSQGDVLRKSGRVVWLPPTTPISPKDSINLLLHERYGLVFEVAPPNWLSNFVLPNENPLKVKITDLEHRIIQSQTSLGHLKEELTDVQRFLKLLYTQGDDVLEPIVREALGVLGAKVTMPKQKGREDGRLIDPSGKQGILEVKGRTGTLKLSDVRELEQWVGDAEEHDNWGGKGILIANLQCDVSPAQRNSIFPDNCVRYAKSNSLCLLTTTQLFQAICQHQVGELDIDGFWETVFTSVGVCSLPELK